MGFSGYCDNVLAGKPLMFLIGFVLAAFAAAQVVVGGIGIKSEGSANMFNQPFFNYIVFQALRCLNA